MATDQTPAAMTAELAEALFTLTSMMTDHANGRLDELSMTMTQCCALRSIDGPTPMKELANRMDIDPSYVTLVADNPNRPPRQATGVWVLSIRLVERGSVCRVGDG